MQIFDAFNVLTDMRCAGARGRVLLPVAVSLALVGCGGGSSTGTTPQVPTVPSERACVSADSGGTGYALGVCADTVVSVFQPIDATVLVGSSPLYSLELSAPPSVPLIPDSLPPIPLDATNRTPVGTRDIIGELRGEAYEDDSDSSITTLEPPYVALIDFRRAWNYLTASPLTDENTAVPVLEFASFGVWEGFPTISSADGYYGGWYAPRPGADALDTRPTTVRQYSGIAVGVLSPSEAGGTYSRSYGFSAKVVLTAGPAGIESGTISSMTISYGPQDKLEVETLALSDLSFSGTDNFTDQPVIGSLVGADATGALEARFLGATSGSPASLGKELAGRFRFQTTDGSKLLGVGAFGVRALDLQ